MVKLLGQMFGQYPWDNPEFKHIYEDLEGNSYDENYTKELADNDPVIGMANDLYSQFKDEVSYDEFQKIFQEQQSAYPFAG
jgi:hypothetical protein